MRMDGLDQVVLRSFQRSAQSRFRDEFGRLGTDDMCSEEFALFRVENHFHETLWMSRRHGLARGGEGELPDLDFMTQLTRFLLGESDARHLRLTVRTARNVLVIHRRGVLAGDRFHAGKAFGRSDVREPGRTHNITDRVNALDVGAVEFIDLDVSAIQSDTVFF